MDVTITCPYCNASPKDIFHELPIPPEAALITKCCNRLVVSYLNTETCQTLIFRPTRSYAERKGYEGDTSSVFNAVLENQRPASKFTWVFQEGFTFGVRLVPKFMDLEIIGRNWGLGMAQQFTSPFEAHRFADSVDEFMLQMIQEFMAMPDRDAKGKFIPKFPPRRR